MSYLSNKSHEIRAREEVLLALSRLNRRTEDLGQSELHRDPLKRKSIKTKYSLKFINKVF